MKSSLTNLSYKWQEEEDPVKAVGFQRDTVFLVAEYSFDGIPILQFIKKVHGRK